MENQVNVGDQKTQQIGQNPVNQSIPAPQKPKINYLLIGIIILVCFVIFGLGGYYLGKQSSTVQRFSGNNLNKPTPSAIPEIISPTTPNQQVNTLPAGWEYKFSQQQSNANECVKIALPPMAELYMHPLDENRKPSVTNDEGSGRFWYIGGGTYPNLLSKLLLVGQEYKQSMAMYATEIEASGYISQAVAVSCLPNNGRFANNSNLISSLTMEIDKYNKSTGEKGMQASTYKIKSNIPATRWGKNVVDLIVTEDTRDVEYTMFVTPQYVYEVKVFGATTNAFVKDTAKKIFNNLSF